MPLKGLEEGAGWELKHRVEGVELVVFRHMVCWLRRRGKFCGMGRKQRLCKNVFVVCWRSLLVLLAQC